MASKLKKIEIGILPSLEGRIIQVALDKFDGNVAAYIRHLIVTDLVTRSFMTHLEASLAKEAHNDGGIPSDPDALPGV